MNALRDCYNIDDLRSAAKRRLPRGVFEFVDRGAEDDLSVRANRAAFEAIQFLPRVGIDVTARSPATTLFGQAVAAPLAIAPTGLTAMLWRDGEYAQACAAADAAIPFTLSMFSLTAVERVAAIAGLNLWTQAYMLADKGLTYGYIERVKAAGSKVLVVTMDCAAPSNREYNSRNHAQPPYPLTLRNAVEMMRHPAWLLDCPIRYMLTGSMPGYANMPPGRAGPVNDIRSYRDMIISAQLAWSDIEQIRKVWPHTLVLKGLSSPADAVIAADLGADGIVVSNHGGRSLDGSAPSVALLPDVVDAARGRMTVLMDGGVRRGADIVKAVALGASGVLAGRPTLYGAATAGGPGVRHALEIFKTETARVLGLLGCNSVADLTRDHVRLPPA